AAHALFVIVVYNFGRFRLGMMPVWMLFAAQGLTWLIAAVRSDSRTTRWQAEMSLVAVLVLSGVSYLPPLGYEQADFPFLHEHTRQQLRQREQDLREVASLRARLARQSDDAAAHQQIAAILLRIGLKTEAVQHYERAIELRPNDAALRLTFAVDLEEVLLDDRRATEQLQAAVRIDPTLATARSRLAMMLVRQKRFAEAKLQFAELVRLEPDQAEHHYNLANVLQAEGQLSSALSELRQAAEHKPLFPEADRLLQKIVTSRSQLLSQADLTQAALALESLSNGYRRAGQRESAENTQQLAKALKDRIDK
ncbi:MAG TPA: tetratricopeptide repeat protein, partial [Planctomycetaceae bacterium]|nr:tetratricopeptide repeat protein [Planctomycetaceae bacterium]